MKTAIVSGAAKGIGRAIAERLIKDGLFVIAIDRDGKEGKAFISTLPAGKAAFYEADISCEAAVKGLFKTISERHNNIYALINNAGIIRDNLIWNMPLSDFESVNNVNLKGAWLMCREVARIMMEQQNGRIVNIASRAWLGNRGQSNYAASKAGLIALTRVLALELGKYNVLVNAVAPGLINTPLTQALKPEALQSLIEAQPTKSMGSAADVAHAVAFLVNEQTAFITGQTIYVDGGKSIGAGL